MQSTLVALRSKGDRPPLFVVHEISGDVLPYGPLALQLQAGMPVYGLQSTGMYDVASVPALAARYLVEIRQVQARGPYRPGGWSFGGLVAYEMASPDAGCG